MHSSLAALHNVHFLLAQLAKKETRGLHPSCENPFHSGSARLWPPSSGTLCGIRLFDRFNASHGTSRRRSSRMHASKQTPKELNFLGYPVLYIHAAKTSCDSLRRDGIGATPTNPTSSSQPTILSTHDDDVITAGVFPNFLSFHST